MSTNLRRHSVQNPARSASQLQAHPSSSSSAPHHHHVQQHHHPHPHHHHHIHHHHVAPAPLPHLPPPDTHNPHLENPANSNEACLCTTCHLRTRLFPRRQDGRIVLPHPWLLASSVHTEELEGQNSRRRAATVSAVLPADHPHRRSERENFQASANDAETSLTGAFRRPSDDASTRLPAAMRSHTSTEPVNDPDRVPHGASDPNRHHHSRIGSIRSRTASTPKPYDISSKKPDSLPRSSNVEATPSSRVARLPSGSFSSHVRPSFGGMEPILASPESQAPQNPVPEHPPRQMGNREFIGTSATRDNTESRSAFVDRGMGVPTSTYSLPDASIHSLPPVASSPSFFADNIDDSTINTVNPDNNRRIDQVPAQLQSRQIRFNPRYENPQPIASSSAVPLLGPGGQFVNSIGVDVDEGPRKAPNRDPARLPIISSPEMSLRRAGQGSSSSGTSTTRIRFQSPVVPNTSLITPINTLNPSTSTSVNPTSSPTQPKELSIIHVKWDSDRKRRQGYFAQSQEEGEEKSPFRHYNKSECDFDR